MPTALYEDGFRFVIFFNDHGPAHVHAYRAGGVVAIDIATGAITARFDMKQRDAVKAVEIVRERKAILLQKWRAIHEPT
jgi:hypothetical protein